MHKHKDFDTEALLDHATHGQSKRVEGSFRTDRKEFYYATVANIGTIA